MLGEQNSIIKARLKEILEFPRIWKLTYEVMWWRLKR
jgi:hypothetical protein